MPPGALGNGASACTDSNEFDEGCELTGALSKSFSDEEDHECAAGHFSEPLDSPPYSPNSEATSPTSMDRLLATLRNDFAFQTGRIRDAAFDFYHVIRETGGPEENAGPLAAFLSIPRETAREIAATDTLFAD